MKCEPIETLTDLTEALEIIKQLREELEIQTNNHFEALQYLNNNGHIWCKVCGWYYRDDGCECPEGRNS